MIIIEKFRMLYKHIRNWLVDRKVGGVSLRGNIETRYKDKGAHDTVNSSYDTLEDAFSRIDIDANDVLVDLGCGKGRVLNYWILKYPINRLVGIELDPNIADTTRRRLSNYSNVEIVTGSAVDNIPNDGTVFCMFNPFDDVIMQRVKKELEDRNVKCIVYLNCRYVDVFDEEKWDVHIFKFKDQTYDKSAIIYKNAK